MADTCASRAAPARTPGWCPGAGHRRGAFPCPRGPRRSPCSPAGSRPPWPRRPPRPRNNAPTHMAADATQSPKLDLHGFFDVVLRGERTRLAAGDSTTLGWSLGQFDLFMSSRLSDRISFLGEAVMETEAGEAGIDLERAYVRYAFSDRLRVTAGRTHSAVSYWYVTCHHGA